MGKKERTNRAQCANSPKLCNQNIEVFETSSCAKNTFKLFISVQSINQLIKSVKVTVASTLKKPYKKKNIKYFKSYQCELKLKNI